MVMAALLLFKGPKMVCAAEDLWHVQSTGMPHGWDVAFYVFEFFKGVLFFTVIALIGTGWSLLKPYLQASGERQEHPDGDNLISSGSEYRQSHYRRRGDCVG